MTRPTNAERAMVSITELSDEAHEDLAVLLNWLATEARYARDRFDKPAQARMGDASHAVARLSQTLYNINRRAQDAQAGRYKNDE